MASASGASNPPTGAVAAPCKIGATATGFEVNAADLPFASVIKSVPATCQFKIARIDVYDSGGAKVDSKPGINATAANLPPIPKKLPAGTYDAYIVPSPTANASLGGDTYNSGEPHIYENCIVKTSLINFTQLKYGFGTGTNVKFPVAVSWSNRSDLITHSSWGAQIGVSYDFSSLLGSGGGKSTK